MLRNKILLPNRAKKAIKALNGARLVSAELQPWNRSTRCSENTNGPLGNAWNFVGDVI